MFWNISATVEIVISQLSQFELPNFPSLKVLIPFNFETETKTLAYENEKKLLSQQILQKIYHFHKLISWFLLEIMP